MTICRQCSARLPTGTPDELCPFCVPDDSAPERGRVLGDCELFEEIGRGGMGVVWRGRQRGLDREVAVKTLPGGDLAGADARARFRIEAQAAARLRHPGIVAVHDVGEAEGMPYFVMELVRGRTLGEALAGKPANARLAARWLRDAALAVQHAHEHGVLHRDIKPSNIIIEDGDDGGRPRVTDFGLAKMTDTDSGLTLTGSAAGSPAFMAPEQVRRGESTALSDVYGLGAVLYTAITGRAPFQGETVAAVLAQVERDEPLPPGRLNPGIPRDLETICLKCLEKNPLRRYPTALALAEDLSRFLAGEPVIARPIGPLAKAARWAARRPALAAALTLAALALVTTAVVAIVAAVRIDDSRNRAVTAANAEKRAADEARRHATRLHIAEANRRQADGDFIGSLSPLVAALRGGLGNPVERGEHTTRLAAALRQCPELVHHWALPSWRDRRDTSLVYPGRVNSADFSVDGKWIAAATGATRLHLWNVETGEDQGADFPGEGVVYVKFSADGRRLLTGTSRDTISLWDFEKREPIFLDIKHALGGSHPSTLLPPVMNRDASRVIRVEPGDGLLSGAYVIFPDAPKVTGAPPQVPLYLNAAVRALALSQDDQRIAVGKRDGGILLHQAGTWLPIGQAFHAGGIVRGMAFNHDASRLAVLSGANDVKLFEITADAVTKLEQTMRHSAFSYTLAWSPDGSRFASGAFGERASFLLRGEDGVADVIVRQPPGVRAAVFSPDGGTLLTAGFDNAARFFDPHTGDPSGPPLHHAGYVSVAIFSPDGRRIFTGSYDGSARLWEIPPPPTAPEDIANSKLSSGSRFLARRDHKQGAFSAITVYSMADGSVHGRTPPGQCAGLTEDGRVLLYRSGNFFDLLAIDGAGAARTLSTFSFPYSSAKGADREAEVSPDGRRAVITLDRQRLHLFDLTTPQAREAGVISLEARFTALCFSGDGTMIAAAGTRPDREAGSIVSIWGIADGRKITSFTTNQRAARIEFSPDSRLLAWGGTVGQLMGAAARVHRCDDGTPATPFLIHRGDILSLEFSPDSRVLATGASDGIARLWNLSAGTLAAPELPHSNAVANVAFSRDGRRLVTTTRSAPAIRVWDTVTGDAMTPPQRLGKGAWNCRFTEDATALITVGDTFIRWPLTDENRTPEDLIAEAELLCAHRNEGDAGQRPIPSAELRRMYESRRRSPAAGR